MSESIGQMIEDRGLDNHPDIVALTKSINTLESAEGPVHDPMLSQRIKDLYFQRRRTYERLLGVEQTAI